MADEDVFTKTVDADAVTEQAPEPTERQQTSMANALWRDGHKHGYGKGGFGLGVFGNFIARCGPEIPCTVQMPNWGFAPITVEDAQ